MDVADRDVQLPGGRVLRALEAGAAGAPAVIYFHSTPQSRLVHRPWLDALAAAGIGVLSWDRPGYGGSTPQPGRQVADVAADAVAVADAAGLGQFAVWGVGGGGPHVNAEQVADVFGAGLPARDREVLSSPQVAAFLLACLREGLTAGPEGWIEDDLAFVAPWGVDLAGTRVPVTLWHGQQDWPTPASHARWLADTIPDAELRLVAEEGALSVIFRHASEVIGWLSAHLPNRR